MYRIMYNVFMYDVFLKCQSQSQSLSLSQSHLASRFFFLVSVSHTVSINDF